MSEPRAFVRARGPEFTNVGLETEVTIPWATYKKMLILGPVSIWCFGWIPGWLIWLRVAMESMSAWRWLTREWWLWASGGGIVWPILMCFVWWGSAPTWATIYRYFIETVYKRTPEYTPWNSENGPWSPGAHRRLEDGTPPDNSDFEKAAETVDINLTTQPKDRKRPQIQRFKGMLTCPEARTFYRAVAEGRTFSERTAVACGLGQKEYNEQIRDRLLRRKMAEWKKDRNHKLGVNLLDSGMAYIQSLSERGTLPPPRRG